MAKLRLIYTPEGGSKRTFEIDMGNPAWDIMYATEKVTDWPWAVFQERLENQSAIAWRALLWVLRKRMEPKLALDSVELNWAELDPEAQCPDCEEWVSEEGHECPAEVVEADAHEYVADVDEQPGESDPEA